MKGWKAIVAVVLGLGGLSAAGDEGGTKFDRIVIDDNFPGGYQVELADVNGDGRLDIIGVGGGTCAWYENPTWKKRVVTTGKQTPGIISSATADLDGDGRAEIAIAYEFSMNEPTKGKLLLASQGAGPDGPWTLGSLTDVRSIHRLRWADLDGDKQFELIVAPIFGLLAKAPEYNDPAHLMVFKIRGDFRGGNGTWEATTIAERPVLHAIRVFEKDGITAILTADNLGVAAFVPPRQGKEWGTFSILDGATGDAPKRGASEVHPGKLAGGLGFFATIEPWHGTQVVISTINPNDPKKDPVRTVIDDTLDLGHALWVADVDGDGDDEVFAGHRGKDGRVSMYDFDGKAWERKVLDPDLTAQDLRGGDLDGDGTPDVVAIGGASHNIVWFRPRKRVR